jgi:MarR family 2-MHQ and catechol resistance regulon transcriptional repressor
MEKGTHIRLILWKAFKAMETVDRASIASTGLCLTDFAVLEILLHKGALPVNVIGQKVLLTSGSITSAINRLEQKGLVRRQRDPYDGRIFRVELTDSGRKLIGAAFADHERNLEAAVAGLTDKERQELVRLLKKLGHHAHKQTVSGR